MQNALEIWGLRKCFEGFSLEDVSFNLPRGYVMGLIGPNGAGKTTTLKTILGLLRRDAGEIRVLGLDPALEGATVRSRIGFVHDEPSLYGHLTLARNAAVVARFYPTWDARAFERLSAVAGADPIRPVAPVRVRPRKRRQLRWQSHTYTFYYILKSSARQQWQQWQQWQWRCG